jgi:hypothetical protein
MNIGERIKQAVKENLGWELAENPQSVGMNKPNVLCCGEHYAIVTCTEDDKPYLQAMEELVADENEDTVKFITKSKGARVPAGKGFGDRVWRENSKHGGIEVSFAKRPDESERAMLKQLGFRWSRMGGVWYIPLKKMLPAVADFLANNGFTKTEGV